MVCGCVALLLPAAIIVAILGLSRQTLATIPDWVYAGILIVSLSGGMGAVILGHRSLQGPRRTAATIGLTMGYCTLAIPVLFVLQSFAGWRANQPVHSNESLAAGLVPILQRTLEDYRHNTGDYPASLSQLDGHAGILARDLLLTGHNNGYIYRYQRTPNGYVLSVDPERPGRSGRRRFEVRK